jgi:hypothetical protein
MSLKFAPRETFMQFCMREAGRPMGWPLMVGVGVSFFVCAILPMTAGGDKKASKYITPAH